MGIFGRTGEKYKNYETADKWVAPERERDASVVYSVGLADDGRIALKIGDTYGSTLLMNGDGARNMIRLLEAAIVSFGDLAESNTDEDDE